MHHQALLVDNFPGEVQRLEAKGVQLMGVQQHAESPELGGLVMLHPRLAKGVLMHLMERRG